MYARIIGGIPIPSGGVSVTIDTAIRDRHGKRRHHEKDMMNDVTIDVRIDVRNDVTIDVRIDVRIDVTIDVRIDVTIDVMNDHRVIGEIGVGVEVAAQALNARGAMRGDTTCEMVTDCQSGG